ncbi:helix-turn-helix domain-containing protein [Companilactobacillus huachuanensis]|uniref:Helix-turn-helix domain-containing protein n=1 Tax=Companilactobacillus huachuanensis TaxID=2559914 RepID=A0ABW1RLJ6_9LACO|nr:helix-turn-helix transcriptional regulator [Companilactobacillus huachuanensis]
MINEIGKIIRDKRKSLGLTIEQLAEKADVSESLVSQLERGVNSNISINKLERISTAMNLKLSDLFDEPASNGIKYLELLDFLASLPRNKREELSEKILDLLSTISDL